MPAPGSPFVVTFKSMLPFAEFVVRKMVVTHVRAYVCMYVRMYLIKYYSISRRRLTNDDHA